MLHGIAHGGEIDYAGNSGEILQEDAARSESNFFVGLRIAVPVGQRVDVFFSHVASIFGAQQVLEKNSQGEGQVSGGDALLVERVEAVDFVLLVSDLERRAGIEAVHRHRGLPSGIAGTRNGCAECKL